MDKVDIKAIIHSQSYTLYKELKKYEPKVDKKTRCIIVANLDYIDAKEIKKICSKKHVKCEVINHNFERGSSYRRTFFDSYKSVNNHYFCAYCGKYIPKDEITVDHIIPIAYAKNNISRQKLLRKIGINNINDKKNLTPSCRKCNLQKGMRTTGWIYRGLIGRSKWFWYIYHSLSFILLNCIINYLYSAILQGKFFVN